MNIPTTVAGVLVILLAVLPGIPGDRLYRALVGVSWRERDVHYLLRLVSFSVLGLAIYVLLAPLISMPPAEYVIPATFSSPSFGAASLRPIAAAYVGHIISATVVGGLVGGSIVSVRAISRGRFGQPDAWDYFIHSAAPGRWVVVKVRSGESYTGFIEHCDVAVEAEYRDLVLMEPYLWNEASRRYAPTFNQLLFLQGSDVVSVAVVHDPAKDRRVVPAAESPFTEEVEHARKPPAQP